MVSYPFSRIWVAVFKFGFLFRRFMRVKGLFTYLRQVVELGILSTIRHAR